MINNYKIIYNTVLNELIEKKTEYKLQFYFLYLLLNYTKNKEYDLIGSYEKKRCTICLDFIEKYQICTKLKCGHTYHIDCISFWKEKKNNCPECRAIILD